MSNLYSLNIGDRVSVTLANGQTYTMTVSQVGEPGSMGTRVSEGPYVVAHIRPGGYSVRLGAPDVAHWEALPVDEWEKALMSDPGPTPSAPLANPGVDPDSVAGRAAAQREREVQARYAQAVALDAESTPEPGYVAHTLTPDMVAKVPAGAFTMVSYAEMIAALTLPSGERPRVYCYLIPEGDQRHGQIARLTSLHYVEHYAERLAFAWISGTTVSDLIRRA